MSSVVVVRVDATRFSVVVAAGAVDDRVVGVDERLHLAGDASSSVGLPVSHLRRPTCRPPFSVSSTPGIASVMMFECELLPGPAGC